MRLDGMFDDGDGTLDPGAEAAGEASNTRRGIRMVSGEAESSCPFHA
jgi:hypothetical protein